MQIDEGGAPTGSLSDYVSERQRQAAFLYIQETAPLRAHLQRLATPLDELLDRFRVRQLLEEVKNKFQKDGVLIKREPPIYRDVVSHPEKGQYRIYDTYPPSEYIPVGYGLRKLLSPDSFQERIPSLVQREGYEMSDFRSIALLYGFALERPCEIITDEKIWVERFSSPGSSRWLGPGGGHIITPGGGKAMVWEKTGNIIYVPGVRAMCVNVLRSSQGSTHVLSFSVTEEERGGVRYNQVSYLDKPRIILANQEPEILKQLVGDRVVRELHYRSNS